MLQQAVCPTRFVPYITGKNRQSAHSAVTSAFQVFVQVNGFLNSAVSFWSGIMPSTYGYSHQVVVRVVQGGALWSGHCWPGRREPTECRYRHRRGVRAIRSTRSPIFRGNAGCLLILLVVYSSNYKLRNDAAGELVYCLVCRGRGTALPLSSRCESGNARRRNASPQGTAAAAVEGTSVPSIQMHQIYHSNSALLDAGKWDGPPTKVR